MSDVSWTPKVDGDQFTAEEANDIVEAINSKSDDDHTHNVSDIADLDEASGGVAVGTGFQAVIDAGGAPEATLAAIVATLADSGGEQVPPAEDTDHWEDTPGLILATPQSLSEAEAEVDLVPSAGNIQMDGTQGWNFATTIVANSDVNAISNLTMRPRNLRALASGGTRTLGFSAADVLIGISTSVSIASGKVASFSLWADAGGDIFVEYHGQQDTAAGGGSLANVVEDTSPDLGGNLGIGAFSVGDAVAADLTKLHALTATSTELNYVDGVTSDIQTQINGKQAASADLTSLVTAWFQATAAGPSSLLFHEDTDNGTNTVTLRGAPSTADVIVTLPAVDGTLLTGAAAEGAAPTFNTIELGTSQTDTTLSRSGAGQLAVEGVNVLLNGGALGTPASGTLTNCTGMPEAGLTVRFVGTQVTAIQAGAFVPATTSGASYGLAELSSAKTMRESYDFDTGADEYVQFAMTPPKRWNKSTVTARFKWSHPSTVTNFDVCWGIQAVALANDDAFDTAFGTGVTCTDAGGTTDDIYLSPATGACTVAGSPGDEEFVIFRVYRDVDGNGTAGDDDLGVDARLHEVLISWTNTTGVDS